MTQNDPSDQKKEGLELVIRSNPFFGDVGCYPTLMVSCPVGANFGDENYLIFK
jgi:hypothetical protein